TKSNACGRFPPPPRTTDSAYIKYTSAKRIIGKSVLTIPSSVTNVPSSFRFVNFTILYPWLDDEGSSTSKVCPSVQKSPRVSAALKIPTNSRNVRKLFHPDSTP